MIFVSSTCSKKRKLAEAITELAQNGFNAIELTGGSDYEPNYLEIILELKEKFKLQYRVHNYFPIPAKAFVLNLASKDANIMKLSTDMILEAFKLSIRIDSDQYGVHAGFRINPAVDELGKKIGKMELTDTEEATKQFLATVKELTNKGKELGVQMYIENNVFSAANYESFNGENPFLLTHYSEYLTLKKDLAASLLLDVAHLKVSSQTLNLNFDEEMGNFLEVSDYVHLSDNDGKSDANLTLKDDSRLMSILKESGLKNKAVTLEVYEDIRSVRSSYELIQKLM